MMPDYVISEAEDRARPHQVTPSNISPWAYGVSQLQGLTHQQCDQLRQLGIDPETADWMWVTVPAPDFDQYDRFAYGRAVQKFACPVIRTVGDRITVVSPRGIVRNVYAGGRISKPVKRKTAGGFNGR